MLGARGALPAEGAGRQRIGGRDRPRRAGEGLGAAADEAREKRRERKRNDAEEERGGAIAILDVARAPHGGRVRLLPENTSAPRITPRLLIMHSIVGSAEGAYRYFRDVTNLESTFIVTLGGQVWQLMDTTRQADANYRANPFAVSVETEDNGDPDSEPWTGPQLDALVWLAEECHRVHRVPLRRADRWDGSGLGYHTLFGAPSPWTPVSKTCPGRARIRQFDQVLLPRIARGGGDDMAGADDVLRAIASLRQDLTVFGTKGLEQTVEDFASRQRETLIKLDDLAARLDTLEARMEELHPSPPPPTAG
jgi:hypothetical protein